MIPPAVSWRYPNSSCKAVAGWRAGSTIGIRFYSGIVEAQYCTKQQHTAPHKTASKQWQIEPTEKYRHIRWRDIP